MYPVEMKLVGSVGEGEVMRKGNLLLQGSRAISLQIKIEREDYPEEEVKKAVKEICEKAIEYYC